MSTTHHRSSAVPLALVLGALVVYASLYPFEGWYWPAGRPWQDHLRLPWPLYRVPFDMWSNLLGYVPLGFLVAIGALRSGVSRPWACLLGLVGPALLSYAMEVVQQFIAGRHPSALDWSLNVAGAFAGAVLAVLAHGLRWLDHWQAARDRWVIRRSRGALVLLLLWPLGLLFPAPFPFGLGLGWEQVQDALIGWLLDVPWAQQALELISDVPVPVDRPAVAVSGLGVLLGLLGPCLLAYAVARPGWRRLVLAVVTVVLGWFSTALSAALNFGPAHAMAWLSAEVVPATATVLVLAVLLMIVGQRLAAALGVLVLSLLVVLVAQVPADPYFATSLADWEQGRFIRFHGLAQWIGWLWPYAAMVWLLARLGHRD